MSQAGKLGSSGSGGAGVLTETGNTGGAVSPDGSGNINVVGTGGITVTGDPGTNTLTISSSGGSGVTTIDGDVGSVTGSTISIITDQVQNNSGGSIEFTGSGTTLTLNTTDSQSNVFIGTGAGLVNPTSMYNSVAIGVGSGPQSDSDNYENVSIGYLAGSGFVTGHNSVAIGSRALSIGDAPFLVAIGASALELSTGYGNVAIGYEALNQLATGTYNVAIGISAGSTYTGSEFSNISINAGSTPVPGESNTCRIGDGTGIGTQELQATYICGIDSVALTTANVVTEAADQLGTAVLTAGAGITIDPASTPNQIIISLIPSSESYKQDIQDIDTQSSSIMQLRPVSFQFKDNANISSQDIGVKHYGFIAEEVNEVLSDLVVKKNNKVESVRYMEMVPLLLNEIQKLRKEVDSLKKGSL